MDSYPLLNIFWTLLVFFIWILWLMLLFRVIADIFRSHDLGGWGKTGWLILVILLPFLGVFIYLIARGESMRRRDMEQAERQEQAFKSYIRETSAGGPSSADELTKLAALRDRGEITPEEFQRAKAKLLT